MPAPSLSPIRVLRAALGLLVLLALAPFWLLLTRQGDPRGRITRTAFAALRWGFGIRLHCHGAALREPGTIYVANHVSWTDIAAFAGAVDVARWPVIGRLATHYGCLFVERERRSAAREQAQAVGETAARSSLVLFPEGTTGLGDRLLPFRSSLFAPFAESSAHRIQPVTIIHRPANGSTPSPEQRRQLAWIGEDTLLGHIRTLVTLRGERIDLWFETPIAGGDRKVMARQCAEAIGTRLAVESGQAAAAEKRAA
jgi:1-acyl-sn-glycerol-3-phosphate acyltransferase